MARSLWRSCVPCAVGDWALDWVEQVTPWEPRSLVGGPTGQPPCSGCSSSSRQGVTLTGQESRRRGHGCSGPRPGTARCVGVALVLGALTYNLGLGCCPSLAAASALVGMFMPL